MCKVFLRILDNLLLVGLGSVFKHYVCLGNFSVNVMMNSHDNCLMNCRVFCQNFLDFLRINVEASNYDYIRNSVKDIHEAFIIYLDIIASVEEALSVKSLCADFRGMKITRRNAWTLNPQNAFRFTSILAFSSLELILIT